MKHHYYHIDCTIHCEGRIIFMNAFERKIVILFIPYSYTKYMFSIIMGKYKRQQLPHFTNRIELAFTFIIIPFIVIAI